jgi:very-short-patch-repair endonuclease
MATDIKLGKGMGEIIMDGLREHPNKGEKLQDNHMMSILQRLYPNREWIYNEYLRDDTGKIVKTKVGKRVRPDFINKELKLVIEIDGDNTIRRGHYSTAEEVLNDQEKDECYQRMGYRVVRIPMYVQLDQKMVKQYFGIDYEKDLYPTCHMHGFAHPLILLPADFCELGVERFEKEMAQLPDSVRKEIIGTLKGRIRQFREKGYDDEQAVSMVLPSRLRYLVE